MSAFIVAAGLIAAFFLGIHLGLVGRWEAVVLTVAIAVVTVLTLAGIYNGEDS